MRGTRREGEIIKIDRNGFEGVNSIISDEVCLTVDQKIVDKAGFFPVRCLLPLNTAASRWISDENSTKKCCYNN